MNRRQLIASLTAWSAALSLASTTGRRPRILLRSSWQVVNIGDIAHTPGVLALLEKHLPQAEVRLWASADLSEEVIQMEKARFPGLQIVKGTINTTGEASNPELTETLGWADFLLHGSGPSLVAAADVAAYAQHFRKPYGVYGITFSPGASALVKATLAAAKFVFFRDSVSLEQAKQDGVDCPLMAFNPDGAFACDLAAADKAAGYLRAHGLEDGKFLCCIPRLRYTPYWLIRAGKAKDETKAARNEAMAEQDHAPLRAAICAVVQETAMKVLICPEDLSQMAVGKEWLYDKLPDAVRSRVVWREDFWLTDEALSTYRRSAGLFGLEMHSPIMCIGQGIPAIVGRFSEQTSKGTMWRDIGLAEWLFDFDQAGEVAQYVPAVLALAKEPATAHKKAAAAQQRVAELFQKSMKILTDQL